MSLPSVAVLVSSSNDFETVDPATKIHRGMTVIVMYLFTIRYDTSRVDFRSARKESLSIQWSRRKEWVVGVGSGVWAIWYLVSTGK